MSNHDMFGKLGEELPGEAQAKAQIARRLGLGFVVIAVLLGVLFLVETQFQEGVDTASEAAKPDPAANLTINTPEHRDAPTNMPNQEVGGQVTPINQAVTAEGDPPIKSVEALPAPSVAPAQSVPITPNTSQPSASGAGSSGARSSGHSPKIHKPVPGVVPTVPLKPAVPSMPLDPTAPTQPAVEVKPKKIQPPVTAHILGGFALQAGVFANHQKAEELHALLTLNGIPSTLETRVQVGPFANKAEAEAARAKLKALGIESLMLPPRK